MEWIHLAQDGVPRRDIGNTVTKLNILFIEDMKLSSQLCDCQILKQYSATVHRVSPTSYPMGSGCNFTQGKAAGA
jgi:hypothetical protein